MNSESFMREAINEALKAKGQTGENPIVGAVIVEDGKIVARGYHKFFGGPHAEVDVIRDWNQEPRTRLSSMSRSSLVAPWEKQVNVRTRLL